MCTIADCWKDAAKCCNMSARSQIWHNMLQNEQNTSGYAGDVHNKSRHVPECYKLSQLVETCRATTTQWTTMMDSVKLQTSRQQGAWMLLAPLSEHTQSITYLTIDLSFECAIPTSKPAFNAPKDHTLLWNFQSNQLWKSVCFDTYVAELAHPWRNISYIWSNLYDA